MKRTCSWSATVAASLVVGIATAAGAAPVDEFYAGKTVSLIVGGSAGGGYDILGRAISRHIGHRIPGNPVVVVQNMPGADGLVSMDYLFHTAARDGTVIVLVENGPPLAPLFDADVSLSREPSDCAKTLALRL
jgi:tripartite-type tricarboxylate transporter receptor subunit TctC